jgi:hypothetical protein
VSLRCVTLRVRVLVRVRVAVLLLVTDDDWVRGIYKNGYEQHDAALEPRLGGMKRRQFVPSFSVLFP